MLTVYDLAFRAQATVWFEVYNGDGDLLFDGDRKELMEALDDKEEPLGFGPDELIEDYWITEEAVLCFHI